jgi:hypothetical protein
MSTPDQEESSRGVIAKVQDEAPCHEVQPGPEPFPRPNVKTAIEASLQEFDDLYRKLARQC